MRRIGQALNWLWSWARSTRFWQYVAPTTTAFYVNRRYVVDTPPPSRLPDAPWAHAQAHALLARSEDRLRSVEAKGPGLATIAGIVAAGVLVALTTGWSRSDDFGRALLVVAAVFSIFSLITPLYLVGPQRRAQLWTADLEEAAGQKSPENLLARRAAEAAMVNSGRVIKLSNLQAAARNDLAWAVIALLLWVVLAPASGALVRDHAARCSSANDSARFGKREDISPWRPHPEYRPRKRGSRECLSD